MPELSRDFPRKKRSVVVFLDIEHLLWLDHEVMRRKAAGENVNEQGKRVFMNRSLVLREIIEEKMKERPHAIEAHVSRPGK